MPMPIPWPVPQQTAPPAPPADPLYGPSIYGPNTGGLADRLGAAFPVFGNVREVASSVRDLMPAVQTARDALRRVRESFGALMPAAAAAPAATPFALAAAPAATSSELVAACQDRSCVAYELRALNAASGEAVRTTQVPDRTPIEVIGDTTGVIALEGAEPRRWSHVRLRATDGSTIEGWMKPENLVNGAPPATSGSVYGPSATRESEALVSPSAGGTSTGCACEKFVPPTSTGQPIPFEAPTELKNLHEAVATFQKMIPVYEAQAAHYRANRATLQGLYFQNLAQQTRLQLQGVQAQIAAYGAEPPLASPFAPPPPEGFPLPPPGAVPPRPPPPAWWPPNPALPLLQAIAAKEAEVAAWTRQLAALRALRLPWGQMQMYEQQLLRVQGELQMLRSQAYAQGNA